MFNGDKMADVDPDEQRDMNNSAKEIIRIEIIKVIVNMTLILESIFMCTLSAMSKVRERAVTDQTNAHYRLFHTKFTYGKRYHYV